MKEKKSIINVQGLAVSIVSHDHDDYISITDIARHRDAERSDYILQNWAGSNSFSLTPKRWIETTKAIGIVSKTIAQQLIEKFKKYKVLPSSP